MHNFCSIKPAPLPKQPLVVSKRLLHFNRVVMYARKQLQRPWALVQLEGFDCKRGGRGGVALESSSCAYEK